MLGTKHISRKFCQRGSKFDFRLVDKGIEDPNTVIKGPSSGYHRPASEMPLKLCLAVGLMMA